MARVNFAKNPADLEVLILGSLGFATDYIAERTKLSVGQVLYRLKHGGVKRADYRHGKTATAQSVIASSRRLLAHTLVNAYPAKAKT